MRVGINLIIRQQWGPIPQQEVKTTGTKQRSRADQRHLQRYYIAEKESRGDAGRQYIRI